MGAGTITARPRVSVIVPIYNGARHLGETLDTLLAQSLTDLEVVAVDDGSSDGSWELLQDYARRDARLRIDRHARNRGHRAASNRAFELSRGTYVARNDQDDLSLPHRLERQAAFLDRHPDVGLLATGYRRLASDGRAEQGPPPTEHAPIRWGLLFDMVFAHSTLMFRRDWISGTSPYRYAPAAYDYEICARLGRVTKLAALPEPLVEYRVHGTGLSTTANHAMLCSAAAISARQLRRLLAPRRLSRPEITSLRSLASAKRVNAADLARIPLFLELVERFGNERGVSPADVDAIRRSWTARMVRHVPLRDLGPLLRRAPAVVGGQVLRRAMHRAGRLGGRLLGAR
jgi:glycosyltransferase involved in cell wall biosynthesis